MTRDSEFGRRYADEQIRRRKHPLRRWIKRFYLRNLLSDVVGPTIDFGCGAGQLLERLPAGSMGLEGNRSLIEFLRSRGLTVGQVELDSTAFDLPGVPGGVFRTLVIAHVLEHLVEPEHALERLLSSCRRLGIERVVIVVPGAKGFASDSTHKTFIDRDRVDARWPAQFKGLRRLPLRYFPGRWPAIGRFFVFHETKIIYEDQSGATAAPPINVAG